MKDSIRYMIERRSAGVPCGIASFCTANELVIEAVLEQAKKNGDVALIEATANQVNQFGGYTGMKPIDFKRFVYQIADKIYFPKENIILGGDHLGPLIWTGENEGVAMEKSKELVRQFVKAGYKKIHLDTSMRLASDSIDEKLSDEVIARRGAELYKVCEEAYQELLKENPSEARPVYIIGSEVPIPGGAQEEEESITVTKPQDVENTLEVYRKEFEKAGIDKAFENVIGIVVQPGVEFGDAEIFHYDRYNAKELCDSVKKYEGIVLEGHSTDYQSPQNLRMMVEDGIAILKVGPALTFALREGLFALSRIEEELITREKRANFIDVLEDVMVSNPENWKKHYHGSEKELQIKRKYSFSDRCRYYFAQPEIIKSMEKLFDNLDSVEIPLSLLQQYMPLQYIKVRDKKLNMKARELAKDNIKMLIEDYNYAVRPGHIIGGIFV
ncbi:class II D-tagatose-bisphosphate aldolase, non-catalytic subunit [Kineothrix sedimenti]|uniref:Class II D-tagatose-bisphosphate aldolase, non-catalytic subunit n=1 Tax=Kineothrix sedimenti TaxID=3123317 RepID=A0ABZ3EZL8_9FIRM